MITQKQLNQYRLEVDSAATDAKNYIKAILEAYQATYPSATVAEIREYTLAAIQDAMYVFGTQACSVANTFFEEIAQQEGAAVQTQIYDTHNNAKAEDKVHWLADKLKNGDISGFNSKAGDLTAFYVKRSAFENMVQNCSKNGIRYARVPSGRETCGFCFMLSSRGFVYTSKKAAGEGHSYHTKCDCVIVPGFHEDTGIDGDSQVEGYKPSELYKRFTECQNAIDPKGDKGLLLERYNVLTKEGATKYTWEQFKRHELIKEIESRDWGWLWNGNEPKIEYETENVKKRVTSTEKHTAEILSNRHGIKCIFKQDYEPVIVNGKKRRRGLADMKDGTELKAIVESQNAFGAVKNHLENANKKRDLKKVIFDLSETKSLSENAIVKQIREQIKDYKNISNVYIITKEKELYKII